MVIRAVLACLSAVTIGSLLYIIPVRDTMQFDWSYVELTSVHLLHHPLGYRALERNDHMSTARLGTML